MAKKEAKATDPRFEVLRMLTVEQKDKLLLKLFRKDPLLVEKLAFEFFEDKSDLKQRVDAIKVKINRQITQSYVTWDTPGELMMEMRSVSGQINEHVKITKDKYGEIELNLLMLNTAFERFWKMLNDKPSRAETFTQYVLKRTETVFKLLSKMHEDNHLDFKEDVNKLLNFIHNYPPTKNNVRSFDIPKDFG